MPTSRGGGRPPSPNPRTPRNRWMQLRCGPGAKTRPAWQGQAASWQARRGHMSSGSSQARPAAA
eukprot:4401896-Prymnesium_polylepis.1